MSSSLSRPFTPAERRSLERLSSSSQLENELLTTAFVFMLVFGLGTATTRCVAGPPSGATLGVIAAVAGALALSLLLYAHLRLGQSLRREREFAAADLAEGVAVIETFEPIDAIQVAEYEDEGSSYYLKLADGRVLFLSGQYLYDFEDVGCRVMRFDGLSSSSAGASIRPARRSRSTASCSAPPASVWPTTS